MKGYGQFCPVAKCAEILGERWTLLLVRELVSGSTRYAELRRGLGSISPSVLADRLKTLEREGIIYRKKISGESKHEYHLTEAGRALGPVIEAAGVWGYRWLRQDIDPEDLDVDLLMLDISRRLEPEQIRADNAVIAFEFTDLNGKYCCWWVLVDDNDVELCFHHPGRKVDLSLRCSLETLSLIWMGRLTIATARREKLLDVKGSPILSANLPDWLNKSRIAEAAS